MHRSPDPLPRIRAARRRDLLFATAALVVLFIASLVLFGLILDLVVRGAPHLDADFFTNYPSRRPSRAGILPAWVGTTLVMLVVAVLAIPLGVGAGIYLEEYARRNWLNDVIEINITNLAGVPSIIYGLLALGLFVHGVGLGESILTAGLTLALLILPIIVVATREALRALPREMREGAFALGADRWQTVALFLLPAARPGILTGIIVGLSRAIGETAPVITIGALTFIAFLPPPPITAEFPWISFDWLWSPFTVLPIQMFNWTSRPQPAFHELAAAAGVVLLVMTLAMNALAIYVRYRARRLLG